MKQKKKKKRPRINVRCEMCGSKNLRLQVPPDFPAFEVCKDCKHIQSWDCE